MMFQSYRQNTAQTFPAGRKQLCIKKSPQFKVNVYNYFLDDFPKTYTLSYNDTIWQLKDMIVKDTQIRLMDIKNFKGQDGQFVKDNQRLSQIYQSDCTLNMEIYFNQDLKITTNSKNVSVFMLDNQNNQNNNEIYNSILRFNKSEKGGKIILGVQSDGLIKGINIPEQDQFKNEFIENFKQMSEFKEKILKYVDISFFRVKGQNKNTYNFNDHKKIVIIKIQGKNKQHSEDQSQISTDDEYPTTVFSNQSLSPSQKDKVFSSSSSDSEDNLNSPRNKSKSLEYQYQNEMYFSPFQYSNPENIQKFIESLAF